jgi:hypothetical protein
MSAIQPKKYITQSATQAEFASRPRYVITFFRDLDISKMGICRPTLKRCELSLIESYPFYLPSAQALVELGRVQIVEKIAEALHQVESLRSAFGREGLTVLELSPEEARELDRALQGLDELSLDEAINKVRTLTKHPQIGKAAQDILNGLETAKQYALGILTTTRQEIQRAKSGKAGRADLDSNDAQACRLLGVSETSVLSSEGEATHSAIKTLAEQFAKAIKPESSSLEELVKAQAEAIEALKRQVAQLSKRA